MPDPLAGSTVAIDARLVGLAAGIARYTVHLTQALAEQSAGERYALLQGRRAPEPWVTHPSITYRRALTPAHHRLERLTLPLEVATLRPTLLHSVDHVAPSWGPWRSVVTVHDLSFLRLPQTHTAESRRYYAATGPSVRRAHRVIAVSQVTARDLMDLLDVDPSRVRVVHEAAAAAYRPRPAAELEQLETALAVSLPRPYILFVGTIEPRKNLPLLLEALALLVREVPVSLVVAGRPGWLEEETFATYRRLGLGDRVHFLGPFDEHQLAALYSHAAAFAFPSFYEGFGLPPLEAMACGAPVVASNAGPMPEVLDDAALLLAPESPRAWADALGRVLSEPSVADDLRRRGFARAAAFSWRETARKTREVYVEAVAA